MNSNWLYSTPIAHRGLHGNGAAENSLTAYKLAIEKGYNIEIDVHLLKDGEFAVFHDRKLKRVCGVEGDVEKLTSDQLKDYKLSGTEDCIPTLREVLATVAGKVGLLIEIKTIFSVSIAAKLYKYMENIGYEGDFAIQCFSPLCLAWYRNHTRNILVGQLGCNFSRSLLWAHLVKPDFMAYNVKELTPKTRKMLYKKAPKLLCWTVRTEEEKALVKANADNLIFEHINPND